jgi:hypothetical protein
MTPSIVTNPDDILLIVFLLAAAFVGMFWLADLWRDCRMADVWRTVYGDFRVARAQRRAERLAAMDVDEHPRVVIRIRDQWEAKR